MIGISKLLSRDDQCFGSKAIDLNYEVIHIKPILAKHLSTSKTVTNNGYCNKLCSTTVL